MQTRKYPRTLNEAFGPYARRLIHPMPEPMHTSDRIALGVSVLAAVALVAFAVVGWL